MSIERLRAHWGLSRMPFGKDLAPSMLHAHRSHAEAAARITWCVEERALGVITGEVGAGKTVAVRAAVAGLETSRFTTLYLGNPAVGARGLYTAIVSALGGVPRYQKAHLIPQVADALAAEEAKRGKRVVLIVDGPSSSAPTNWKNSGSSPTPRWTRILRSPACSSVSPRFVGA